MTHGRHRSMASGPAPRVAHGRQVRPDSTLTMATLLLASSLTVMAGAVIAPALPAMEAHFADVPNSGTWVRLVLTISALPIVLGAPLAGLIGDRGGRTRLLLASILLFAGAGSSGLYLDSLGAILVGRVLLGAAMAGLMTSTTALIADYYDGAQRARFMGWQAAAMTLGGVVFLTGGGLLAELGWRFPFAIYLLPLPLVVLAWYALPEPVRSGASTHGGRPSHDGATPRGTTSLQSDEPVPGNDSAPGDQSAARDAACEKTTAREKITTWERTTARDGITARERTTAREGSIAREEIGTRDAGAGPLLALAPIYGMAFLGMVAFYLIPSQLPFHLEALLGAGPTVSGAAIALSNLAGMFTALAYGQVRARIGFTPILALTLLLMGASFLMIWHANGFMLVLAALTIGGLGMGFLMPNFNLWVATTSPASLRGRALGGLATAVFLGQFVSPLASQAIAGKIGLGATFGTVGVALLLLAAGLWLPRLWSPRRPTRAARTTMPDIVHRAAS